MILAGHLPFGPELAVSTGEAFRADGYTYDDVGLRIGVAVVPLVRWPSVIGKPEPLRGSRVDATTTDIRWSTGT